VTKSNVMSSTATVELSAEPSQVTKAVADLNDISVDTLLPGTLLNVSVSKVIGKKCRSIFIVFLLLRMMFNLTDLFLCILGTNVQWGSCTFLSACFISKNF